MLHFGASLRLIGRPPNVNLPGDNSGGAIGDIPGDNAAASEYNGLNFLDRAPQPHQSASLLKNSVLTIGILGGMGPQAGIDLATKIVSETDASIDQDHIPVILYGHPGIPDRTAFLFGKTSLNPAIAIASGLEKLSLAGADVAGIACNTAHSPSIIGEVGRLLDEAGCDLKILHLIGETVRALTILLPNVKRVGVLGTKGTLKFRLYDDPLEEAGIAVIHPKDLDALNGAIFDPEFGMKGFSSPVSQKARTSVLRAVDDVVEQGAEAVILGCTELPLAVSGDYRAGIPLIDPGQVLAGALVTAGAPDRLRPLRVPLTSVE